jgi:hypothetical protein
VAECVPVSRIDPTTGAVVWSASVAKAGTCVRLSSMALDETASVVVTGSLTVKLDAATGTERWRNETSLLQASDVATDATGHVYVAGAIAGQAPDPFDFGVVKLDGTTGDELWRYSLNGGAPNESTSDYAYDLALDPAGDVIATGSVRMISGYSFTTVKLAGIDGSELWRRDVGGFKLLTDGAGDAYLGPPGVRKLSGLTGGDVWWWPATLDYEWTVLQHDASTHELVVRGRPYSGDNFRLVRLRAGTGQVTWESNPPVYIGALVLGNEGRIHVAGSDTEYLERFRGFDSSVGFFRVASFSDRLTGAWLRFVEPPGNPAGRGLIIKSTDPLTLGSRRSTGATDPSLGGATLTVRNPDSGEVASIALPAAYWSSIGSSVGSVPGPGKPRWSYRDGARAAGPCKRVTVSDGKGIKITCAGSGIPAFLDEASQGRLEVMLTLGTAQTQCFQFGGDVRLDRPGAFVASDAPRPDACPAP